MMTQPVRIGIVGCGDVLGAYMTAIELLRGRGLVEAVAACAKTEEKRNYVLDECGITNFTTDYHELVQSDAVDLVLVLTSMREHGPVTLAALEAGKHVLVEKPMAVTQEEAAQIVELSKKSPGYLVCAPYVILSPTYQAIGRRVQAGDIGKVLSARGRYGWSGPWWGKWFYRAGGGALFDMGVYPITSLTGLLGPAKRVMAMTGVAIPERNVDGERIRVEAEDNAHVLLDFGEARFAAATTGFTIQKHRSPALEIYGSRGTIQLLGDDWHPQGYELWQNEVGAWQVFPEVNPYWRWTDGLRHIVECIQQNTPPTIAPEHAYHVLEVMLKAQESGRDGQAKPIESTFTVPMFEALEETAPAYSAHDPGRR